MKLYAALTRVVDHLLQQSRRVERGIRHFGSVSEAAISENGFTSLHPTDGNGTRFNTLILATFDDRLKFFLVVKEKVARNMHADAAWIARSYQLIALLAELSRGCIVKPHSYIQC